MNGIDAFAVLVVDDELIQAQRQEVILAAELLGSLPHQGKDTVLLAQGLHHDIVFPIVRYA